MLKKALITGINGQDGSYLAEFLLEKNYEVWGTVKRNSVSENQTYRIEHIRNDLNLIYADMTDMSSLVYSIKKSNPDEIYNLAAQSHVRISFDQPIYTSFATAIGVLNLLESVRLIKPDTKIYQASSSEMFGNCIDPDGFQREGTRMLPVSPYGCSKVYAYNICHNYRNSYKLFICNGILFNHESPRRGLNFVTSKIVKGAVDIYYNKVNKLVLGNMNSSRDWGHAKDYIKAMWMIMQESKAEDYICATGISHTVKDLVDYVFNILNLNPDRYVISDEKFLRPEELDNLKGDASKLRNNLGWKPDFTFETLLDEMIEYWLEKEKS